MSEGTGKIKRVVHPDAFSIRDTWTDEARVTGQVMIERPFWYENTETGQWYYDIYGCIGWPSEVSDIDEGLPGYAAVVGVVKPKSGNKSPADAVFQIVTEYESRDVPTLLEALVGLRSEYGFGLYPELLHAWYGDPERFVTILALMNEKLIAKGGDKASVLISPPDDFYGQKVFEHYVRSLRSVVMPDKVRLYFGKGNDILKGRMREFRLGDPAVYAMGGLVHSLLSSTVWMDQIRANTFNVEENDA
jgi:hypothetical protein